MDEESERVWRGDGGQRLRCMYDGRVRVGEHRGGDRDEERPRLGMRAQVSSGLDHGKESK